MKPCTYYAHDRYCGDPDTRRYINGHYCRLHTPSVISGGEPISPEKWAEGQAMMREAHEERQRERHQEADIQARARRSDPRTSHEAAASVRGITATHRRILTLMEMFGPLTDDEIAARYRSEAKSMGWPPVSPSGLRTRRAELVDLGRVLDTRRTKATISGRRTTVWALPNTSSGGLDVLNPG